MPPKQSFTNDYTVPVFFIHGEEDYLVSRELLGDYYEMINAPLKKLYYIENAGHMTMTDNPDGFAHILLGEIRPLLDD